MEVVEDSDASAIRTHQSNKFTVSWTTGELLHELVLDASIFEASAWKLLLPVIGRAHIKATVLPMIILVQGITLMHDPSST